MELPKNAIFATLELLRNIVQDSPRFKGRDWKDADDYLFSTLPFTTAQLDEIYAGRNVQVYYGSAIKDNSSAQSFSLASFRQQAKVEQDILDTLESALALAKYEILDGERRSLTIRDSSSDTDYRVTIEKVPG